MKASTRKVRFSVVSLASAFGLALAIQAGLATSVTQARGLGGAPDGTSTTHWIWQNPRPTGNYLTGVDLTDSNSGTLVGIAGTIMHTSDGGLSWAIQSSGTIETLEAVCFIDSSTGTVVGDSGVILQTTDAGLTWIQRASGIQDSLRAVSFGDANNGTAVGLGGRILHTTDGGVTWTSQSTGTARHLFGVHC